MYIHMKKILAFGASSSKNSINHTFALWAASQLVDVEITSPHLREFEMPIFSVDREKEDGYPQFAHDFIQLINESDGIIISLAEHNGSFAAAFKNIYDWISRIEKPIWKNKPMMIMATSPGGRGGKTVLQSAETLFPRTGALINGVFSLPSFGQNFDDGIVNTELLDQFNEQLQLFEKAVDDTLVTG